MTHPTLKDEIYFRTDMADGMRSRMAKQDNGHQLHKINCVKSTIERLKALEAVERRERGGAE